MVQLSSLSLYSGYLRVYETSAHGEHQPLVRFDLMDINDGPATYDRCCVNQGKWNTKDLLNIIATLIEAGREFPK